MVEDQEERENVDGRAVIESAWPYDGPHDDDTVSSAAAALSALIRYLNNATGPWNARQSLAWAATAGRIVAELSTAVFGMQQLVQQLEIAMRRQLADLTLYDDRHDRPAVLTAVEVLDHLAAAGETLPRLRHELVAAHRAASHLGNHHND